MTSFSSILDISSFFIGVLVNLLLVAMICFYFKRKIDNLELSHSEQAKVLYKLLQKDSNSEEQHILNNIDLDTLTEEKEYNMNNEKVDESEDESGDESEDESGDESEDESEDESDKEDDNVENNVKQIVYEEEEEVKTIEQIEKLTIKEIRSLLEKKGVSVTKKSVKKQELVDLYKNEIEEKQNIKVNKHEDEMVVINEDVKDLKLEEEEEQEEMKLNLTAILDTTIANDSQINVNDVVELNNEDIYDISEKND